MWLGVKNMLFLLFFERMIIILLLTLLIKLIVLHPFTVL